MPVPTAPYYRLRLQSLKFISAVDAGAQGPIANVALIKRAPTGEIVDATFRVVKVDEKLGLVFGWALATSLDGGSTPHVDLQEDAIIGDDELIKVAAEFMEVSAASDVMHDDNPDGKIVFCMPLTKDVSTALGVTSKVHGLAIAMRPSPDTFKRFVAKELNAFSIAGTGIRELVKAAQPKCPSCGAYGKADDKDCPSCGKTMKRARRPVRSAPATTAKSVWTTADMDQLPDSSFFYVEPGGSKDSDGKTTPRSLRHFPYRDASGKIDLDHLRNAISRIPQSSLSKDLRDKLQVRAEKLLAAQHAKRFTKATQGGESTVVATSEDEGHQHTIDLDDPADGWQDQLTTSYNTAAGATNGHSHGWVFDPATGKVTILADSGHSHTVDGVVPPDVIRQVQLNETGERCEGCGEMCDPDCRFCPKCGASMDDDDEPSVIVISARAPAAISTPPEGASTVKSITEEHQMADPNELTALKAENALLKHLATLTDAQRDHHNRLLAKGIKSDADAFLVLDRAQRNSVLAEIEKANVEVYTSKSTGRVYRMSDDVEKIEAAKQTDAMLEMTKRAEDKERELDFTKRAGELIPGCFKGVKNNVPARLIKAIRAEFKEPAELAEAEKALKQYEVALAMLSKSVGYSATDDTATDTPAKRFEAAINDYAKRNNLSIPAAIAKATEADPEIRRLYNEASLLAS